MTSKTLKTAGSESGNLRLLRRNPLFNALPAEMIVHLSRNASVLDAPHGRRLYRSGARPPGVYIVVSGCWMLNVDAPDAHRVIELVGAGGYLGLAAAVLGVPETVTAEALIDSALLLIPRAALLECAAANPPCAIRLAKALARQVQRLTADIEGFSLHSGRERVADYLLQLAAGSGAQSSPFALPAKKSVIASLLSLTPEYFSRTLHELIEAGAITVDGRQVTVIDPMRLRQQEI